MPTPAPLAAEPDGAPFDGAGLDGVVGHAGPADRFRRTLASGRLASTYLFVGPRGIGKRHFATRLARVLLCRDGDHLRLAGCGACESCKLFDAASHPDLIRVARPAGKSTLPLEAFLGPPEHRGRSGLCHDLALRPAVSPRRVAVIDDADYFSAESANCLLKTLEEPPPRSLLVLIGTSLARQLPTIRSRSQVVRFAPLSTDEVARVLAAPPHGRDEAEAQRMAHGAGGSVAGALDGADEGLAASLRAVREAIEVPRLDPLRLAKVLEEETKSAGAEPSLRRDRTRALLGAIADAYRERLRAAAAEGAATDRELQALEACLEADAALERNANQSALILHLATRLGRLSG
ncbi:MAG: ATP-binding protein [Lacipirellulaceae bacterium]